MKSSKTKLIGLLLVLLALIPAVLVLAADGFELVARPAGGGAAASGGAYRLQALIGQPEAGRLTGSDYHLNGGVLGEVLSTPTPSITPSPTPDLTGTSMAQTATATAQTATVVAGLTQTSIAQTATAGATQTQIAQTVTAIAQTGTPAALTATAGATQTQIAQTATAMAQTGTPAALTATAAAWTPTPTLTPTKNLGLKMIYLPLMLNKWLDQVELEPNNLFVQANPVMAGQIFGHHDGAAGTGDVFRIELQAGQIVDVLLSTQNPNGVQLIAYGGEAPDEIVRDFSEPFEINFVAVATGTYYLYVFTPGGANNSGAYTLTVRVASGR